jgi:hypothetical protein
MHMAKRILDSAGRIFCGLGICLAVIVVVIYGLSLIRPELNLSPFSPAIILLGVGPAVWFSTHIKDLNKLFRIQLLFLFWAGVIKIGIKAYLGELETIDFVDLLMYTIALAFIHFETQIENKLKPYAKK